jgi:hypothetical protein
MGSWQYQNTQRMAPLDWALLIKNPMTDRKMSFNKTTRTYSPIDGPCEHRLEIPVSEGGDILFWRCQCGLRREKAPSKQKTEQRK